MLGDHDHVTADNIAFILLDKEYNVMRYNGTVIVKLLYSNNNTTRIRGEDARLYWFKKRLFITYNYIDTHQFTHKKRHVRYVEIDLIKSKWLP